MTDQELIAEARRIGPVLRGRPGDLDRYAGWLMLEAAHRLDGRAAAQAKEDSYRPHELPHAYDADSHVHGRPCTLCGKGPDNPVHRI